MTNKIFFLSVLAAAALLACLTAGCNHGCPACKEAGLIHCRSHGKTPPDSRTITEFDTDSKVTVWITNSNGSMTPITLTKTGDTYTGPNKEKYNQMPTPKQIKQTYGF
ncbi:MAG: hypothetical protein KAS23_13990 [Anaerohalosphaera sp.]|nr:hypothetical protein [Anaerohalosphaera sp.]